MIAHYLVFIGMTVDSIFIWIGYFTTRWIIKTQLANDMTILYKAPGAVQVNDSNTEGSFTRAVSSSAIILSVWLVTRYGYHASMHFTILCTFRFAFDITRLFNKLKPGIKEMLYIFC